MFIPRWSSTWAARNKLLQARVTKECLVRHLEHILTLLVRPCCLQNCFSHFLLSLLFLNMICQRKCTNGQQPPPLCLVVGTLWRRLKPAESGTRLLLISYGSSHPCSPHVAQNLATYRQYKWHFRDVFSSSGFLQPLEFGLEKSLIIES